MTERVAIVTGGTRGIGAAISEVLAADGTHVAAVYAGNHDAARELAGRLAATGGSVSVHAGDVGDPEFCQALVAGLVAERGRVDDLVSNAGLLIENSVTRMTADQWEAALRVNLSASFHLAQAVIAPMTAQGSDRIVNIGSVTAASAAPFVVTRVGPAIAVECPRRSGAHLNSAEWTVAERDGELFVSTAGPCAHQVSRAPAGLRGILAEGPCACGRPSQRIVVTEGAST
jgi:NAD(P)-dependent dehydrogenase (short-subunit alcohol dehydrogenase family)